MNDSVITAFAALAGAAIGGLMSVVASYLTQRTQGRQQWILQERHRRQELYREFVEEASKCHIHALQHEEADISPLVTMYTKIGRMRVLSSPAVIASAEQVGQQILAAYLEPNKELRDMVHTGSIDVLHDFTSLSAGARSAASLSNRHGSRATASSSRVSKLASFFRNRLGLSLAAEHSVGCG